MPKEHFKALQEAAKDLKIKSNFLERKPKHRKSKPNEKKIYCPRCRKFIEVAHADIILRECDGCDTIFKVHLNKST